MPADLVGTLYRNGPGVFAQAPQSAGHPLTAPGAVSAVRLGRSGALGACRVLPAMPTCVGDALHPPNTNVLELSGRLLALNEGRTPVELCSESLRVKGEFTFDDTLQTAFCAHPHDVVALETTFNVGVEYGQVPRLHIYALGRDATCRHLGAIDLPWAPMVHDFAVTERHLVAFVSPLCFRPMYRQLELGGISEWYRWQAERGTEVIVVPLADPARVVRWEVGPFFQWHFVNAFEAGASGSTVVVDYIRLPDAASFESFPSDAPWAPFEHARCHRARLDLASRTFDSTELAPVACDFPRIDPRRGGLPHRYVWALAADLRSLVCLDVQSGAVARWRLPDGQWASEPVFVPARGSLRETAGYVLSLCFDRASDRSHLAILDAERFEEGPVARVWFEHYLPPTFHGSWVGPS